MSSNSNIKEKNEEDFSFHTLNEGDLSNLRKFKSNPANFSKKNKKISSKDSFIKSNNIKIGFDENNTNNAHEFFREVNWNYHKEKSKTPPFLEVKTFLFKICLNLNLAYIFKN